MQITLKESLGVDSNIIIYSIDQNSRYYAAVQHFFLKTIQTDIPLFITHQNIIETEKALIDGYKFTYQQAVEDVLLFINTFRISIVHPLPTTISLYHDLLIQKKSRDIFDLFLAATYLDNGIANLLTINTKDFTDIPGFVAIDPAKIL